MGNAEHRPTDQPPPSIASLRSPTFGPQADRAPLRTGTSVRLAWICRSARRCGSATHPVGVAARRQTVLLGRSRRPARRTRRYVAGHTTLQGVQSPALVESTQIASDHRAGGYQAHKVRAHRGQRQSRLFGDFHVEPLTVFLQAFQHFHFGSPGRLPLRSCVLDDASEQVSTHDIAGQLTAAFGATLDPAHGVDVRCRGMPVYPAGACRDTRCQSDADRDRHSSCGICAPRFHQSTDPKKRQRCGIQAEEPPIARLIARQPCAIALPLRPNHGDPLRREAHYIGYVYTSPRDRSNSPETSWRLGS